MIEVEKYTPMSSPQARPYSLTLLMPIGWGALRGLPMANELLPQVEMGLCGYGTPTADTLVSHITDTPVNISLTLSPGFGKPYGLLMENTLLPAALTQRSGFGKP